MSESIEKISLLISALNNDIDFSINKLNRLEDSDPEYAFYARSYVRATASWAEGFVWVVKHVIGKVEYQWHKNLPVESQLYLFDIDWAISNSGKPKVTTKKLRTRDNIKAFFYLSHQLLGCHAVDYSSNGWNDLMYFFSVRDGMMHPSDMESLHLTKESLMRCERGRIWLKDNFKEVMISVVKIIDAS